MRDDINCDCKTVLASQSVLRIDKRSRFSPQQLILGKNINLPSIYSDQPSTDLPQNEIVIEHSSVSHVTKQAFMTAELYQKLKVALQRKTHQTREHFDHGLQVYYNQMII